MFGIRDLLFGKKVMVNVPDLGTFEARVKKNRLKEITWFSEANIASKNKDLVLMLLGNGKGPYQSQIENVQFILKDEENIRTKIVDEIANDKKMQLKFQGQKIEDFNLTCIYTWKNDEISYELSFESANDGYIGVIHTGQKTECVFF